MTRLIRTPIALAAMTLLITAAVPAAVLAAKDDVARQVEQPVREAIEIRRAAQQDEEQWREERARLTAAYDALQEERARLDSQRAALAERVAAARARVAAKQAQLAAIDQITDQVAPFLDGLRQGLARRIETDLPFLPEERQRRLENLTTLLEDPGISASDKFRKVFEALLVEAEYGNTIEVYQEEITVEGRSMLVHIFRLGRIGLYYQSLDRQTCGFFNAADAAWQPLDAAANRTLQTAIDIGAKRKPVEILNLPLGRIAPQ